MSKDFATLLAQVIPVIILALILELGNMINRIHTEGEQLKADISEVAKILKREIENAERLIAEAESLGDTISGFTLRGQTQELQSLRESSEQQQERLNMARKKNALNSLFLMSFYGLILATLSFCEILSLQAADGGSAPEWAENLSVTSIALGMFAVIAYPIFGWFVTNSSTLQELEVSKWTITRTITPAVVLAFVIGLVSILAR